MSFVSKRVHFERANTSKRNCIVAKKNVVVSPVVETVVETVVAHQADQAVATNTGKTPEGAPVNLYAPFAQRFSGAVAGTGGVHGWNKPVGEDAKAERNATTGPRRKAMLAALYVMARKTDFKPVMFSWREVATTATPICKTAHASAHPIMCPAAPPVGNEETGALVAGSGNGLVGLTDRGRKYCEKHLASEIAQLTAE